jgi:hypothetical protein
MELSNESAPRTPCPAPGFRSRIVLLDALLAGLGICESSSSGEAIKAQRLRGFEDVEAAAR